MPGLFMKLKKTHLKKIIENFLFEKKQKIDKEFLENIVSTTGVKHNKTGIEYTIEKDITPDNKEDIFLYRYDIDNPDIKIKDTVSYKEFLEEFSLV